MSTGRRWLGVVALAAGGAGWLVRRRLILVSVHGTSMSPTLRPGDRRLAWRPGRARPARVRGGDVVVFVPPGSGPGEPPFIKRVTALPGDPVPGRRAVTVPAGHLWVVGDGSPSADSRDFGPVALRSVVARVLRC